MIQVRECNLCGKSLFDPLFIMQDSQISGIPEEYTVVVCTECRLLFVNPQPTMQELSKHYPNSYYSFVPRVIFKKLQVLIYKTYFSKKGNWFFKLLFYPVRRRCRSMSVVEKGNFLDVGCGSGAFLLIVKELGMNCYGVEPGDFNKEFAVKNNLNIFQGILEDARFPKDFFDSIMLSHSFEHFHDPFSALLELKRIVKPGGLIRLTLPHGRSFAFWLFGRYWEQLDVPRHLYTFSASHFHLYAQKTGLKVRKIACISHSRNFMVSLIRLIKAHAGEPLCNIIQSKPMMAIWGILWIALFPFILILDIAGIGDGLEVIFTKE